MLVECPCTKVEIEMEYVSGDWCTDEDRAWVKFRGISPWMRFSRIVKDEQKPMVQNRR